jgi:plastocyanin
LTPTDATHGHIGGTDNTGVPGPGGATCISKAPGELYTAAEAVIRFSPESICPGFVTVSPRTPVTFANLGTEPYTVTLTRGTQADGPVLATEAVAPGATWVQTFDATGDVAFRISAIRSFVGTIYVP